MKRASKSKLKEQTVPRILYMEDNDNERASVTSMLTRLPARVDAVGNGDAAMDALIAASDDRDPYKLVILDMWVPRSGKPQETADHSLGLTLLIELQRAYGLIERGTPIIVFTNHDDYDDCVACIKAGAHSYIPKTPKLKPNSTNTRLLIERCRQLLYPAPEADLLDAWLRTNLARLVRDYAGQVVGLIPEEAAKTAKLHGKPIDGFVLLSGGSYGEVRTKILRNKILRWERPRIIDVPIGEDIGK
ncbi:MAG: response regulator [Phycisphaerales bacterium]